MLTIRLPNFPVVVLLALPVTVCGEAVAQLQTAVNPPGNATVEGNSRRGFFSNTATGRTRHQEIIGFSGNPFQGLIQRVAYRRDNDTIVASGNYAAFSPDFDMTLSTSPNNTLTMSPDFASNIGADAMLVHSGPVSWPAEAKMPPGPTPFNYAVALSSFFPYQSTNGDLCVEIITQPITNPNSLFFIDADASSAGSSDMVLGAPCGTGSANDSYVSDNWGPGAYAYAVQDNGPHSVPSVATFGTTSPTIAGIPLPVDLFFIGAPGCLLQSDVALGQFPGMTTSSGRWDLYFTIPNLPTLGGQHVRFQWVNVLDAGAGNAAQLSVTAGHEVTIATPMPGTPPQSESLASFTTSSTTIPTTAALVQQGYGFVIELGY